VVTGKLNPQIAFMQGKMKVKGSMKAAMKFTPDLFPPMPNGLMEMDLNKAIQTYCGGAVPPAAPSARPPPAAAAAAGLSSAASQLKAAPLVSMMQTHMKTTAGKQLVNKVGYVYRFDVLPKKGAAAVSFTIDLKNAPGKIAEGAPEECDAHFTMVDEDFVSVVTGKLNPQIAFMQGKMKVKGSMKAAMKFTPDLFPAPSKL